MSLAPPQQQRKREYYDAFESRGAHSEHYRPTQVIENRRVDARRARVAGQWDQRRVNAAQGLDITQKYDAFGNNSFTSADNPWAAFFGTPAHPYKTTSYDKYDRHNYNLPEAYVGKNEMISQTIDELIYSDETFYTSVLLPYNFTDQLSVAWDKWEFNEHFTGIVPEQGVSRLVSSHRESRSEQFLRRGLGAMWEHGFMSTREGRANYFMTLAQIARAVQETTNFGVIYAFLTCHNYNKTWEERHGYFRRSTITEILERERFMWAIAIKMEFGMEKLDAQIVEWMDRYRSSADTWLLPPKPATYLRLVPAEKVYQYLAGDMGPARVNDMVGAGRPRAANAMGNRINDMPEAYAVYKNNRVYITRTYHVQRTGPIDLMMRISSLGEYFKMVNSAPTCDLRSGYNSCMSDVKIYDESNDTGFVVSARNFIQYGQLFNEDGTPREIPNNVAPSDIEQLKRCFFVLPRMRQGQEVCTQIQYMGDMDPQFFGPSDAHKLAMTAVASAYRSDDERKKMQLALDEGMRLIERMAVAAPGVGGGATFMETYGAQTNWAALQNISNVGGGPARFAENAIIGRFVDAVEDAARLLGPLFGGPDNLFLNSKYLPQGKTAPEALYENLLSAGRVPLFAVPADQQATVRQNNRERTVTQLLGYLRSAPLVNASVIATRMWSPEEQRQAEDLRAAIAPIEETLSQGITVQSTADSDYYRSLFHDAIGVLQQVSWKVTNGQDEATWKKYVASLSNRWDRTVTAAQNKDMQTGAEEQQRIAAQAAPVKTEYAISRNNPHYLDGSLRAKGFLAASATNRDVPEDAASSLDFEGSGPQQIIQGSPINFMQIPFIQALSNAVYEAEGEQQSQQFIRRRNQPGASASYRPRGAGLHQYEDNETYTAPSATIGAMYDYSPSAREAHSKHLLSFAAFAGVSQAEETTATRFGTLAYNVEKIATLPMTTLERIAAFLYYGTLWHRTSLEVFHDNNVMLPFNGIGARIGMYEMALGIKCQAGGGTGYTYFGHSNFLLGDDAAIKMHYGHYTHYGKSVIHAPEKVFVAYDIFPNRCLGGMGTLPYERPEQYDPVEQIFQADIFYMLVAFTETRFPTVFSLTGRFDTFMDLGMIDDDEGHPDVLHYSTCAYYKRVWRWRSEDDIPIELDEPMYRMYKPGHMYHVWQGAQGSFSGHDTYKRNIIRNKSPWGPNVYAGCKDTRNGMMARLEQVPHGELGF